MGEGRGARQLLLGGPKAVSSPSWGPPRTRPRRSESPFAVILCSHILSSPGAPLPPPHLLLHNGGLGWDVFIGGVVFNLVRVGK